MYLRKWYRPRTENVKMELETGQKHGREQEITHSSEPSSALKANSSSVGEENPFCYVVREFISAFMRAHTLSGGTTPSAFYAICKT
jgi:hypothetical protein